MRLVMFTKRAARGSAIVALAGVLVLGWAPHARAEGNPAGVGSRTLEGTWWVRVTVLTDCTSRMPLATFTALLTFAEGGTMVGTTTNPSFAPGQRSQDHGIWFRYGLRRYRASSVALIQFPSAPNLPVSPGFQAGSHRLDQVIELTDRDHFSSDTLVGFYDTAGAKYREGCATALGQRFE